MCKPVLAGMAAAQASLADSAVVVDLPPKPESQLAKEVTLTEEDKALLELLFDEYEDALGQKLKPLRKLKADWESELSSDIEELEEDGETFEAEPLLCRLAYYQLQMRGPDHPTTIQTVFRLTQNINQQGGNDIDYLTWLLPRFTALHGLNHPDTRKLVEQAALHLCQTEDDREHPEFSKIVTELVGQLPGGLGWGNTMSTPITDEAAFNRHVVMEQRAAKAFVDGHYKLSQDMYQRCVASFSTLGAHWLGTPRRLRCLHGIAMATIALEGGAAAQQKAQDVKSMCQRELGPRHEVTLELALQVRGSAHHKTSQNSITRTSQDTCCQALMLRAFKMQETMRMMHLFFLSTRAEHYTSPANGPRRASPVRSSKNTEDPEGNTRPSPREGH